MAIYTQAQIDTLTAAIASGVLIVRYSGPPAREVTYNSLEAMRAQLAVMIADVNSATRTSIRRVRTNKGFDT